MIEAPQSPKTEAAIALLKAAVSELPGGTIAAEVLGLFNPLEKRKQKWMEEISEAVNEIRASIGRTPQDLEQDSNFVSFLYQATAIAIKNHQRAKLGALRNALVSVAANQVQEDVGFQYLRYVDELTSSHLVLLAALANANLTQCKSIDLVYACVAQFLPASIDRLSFRMFLQDLDSRFLVRINDLEDFPEYASTASYIALESSEIKPLEVTQLGQSFIAFVKA
jgi:hypothetical protein